MAVLAVNDEQVIYVGSNDACIYGYDIVDSQPKFILIGHSGTGKLTLNFPNSSINVFHFSQVCSLHADNGNSTLMSGSWDQESHIWKDNQSILVLKGHSGAVWAVSSLQDEILTGSADKTIKRWDKEGKCLNTYEKHTDCVRDIVILSSKRFLSCGNDAKILLWNLPNGEVVHTFDGHENFIYCLSVLNASDDEPEFVTCSEDRTVRVWKGLNPEVQSIRLPASTLWSVAAIDRENIAIGCSDGKVYTFTRDDERVASEAETKSFEDEVSKSSVPLAELGDIKADQLPGKEALGVPGKREGATKLIREDGKICIYQWDSSKFEWTKVGDVVGNADQDKDPSAKTLFEGKEYDFVFNVDIQDGVPPLKLPFNLGDDPYMAAQQFIHKHDLSQYFLDQIANFIIKNVGPSATSTTQPSQASNDYVDPWTGSSRYVPR